MEHYRQWQGNLMMPWRTPASPAPAWPTNTATLSHTGGTENGRPAKLDRSPVPRPSRPCQQRQTCSRWKIEKHLHPITFFGTAGTAVVRAKIEARQTEI